MLALSLLFACAPEPVYACDALQDELVACGFERDAYECHPGEPTPDEALVACMADYIAAEGCDRNADEYTDLTVPAFEACS